MKPVALFLVVCFASGPLVGLRAEEVTKYGSVNGSNKVVVKSDQAKKLEENLWILDLPQQVAATVEATPAQHWELESITPGETDTKMFKKSDDVLTFTVVFKATAAAKDVDEDVTDTVEVEIKVPQIKLDKLSFSGDDNHRMLDITSSFAETQGQPIESPEWKAESVDQAKPICYTMGKKPTIKADFKVEPNLQSHTMSVKVKAEFDQEAYPVKFPEKTLSLTEGSGVVDNWRASDDLKKSVYKGEFNGSFEVSYDKSDQYEKISEKPSIQLYSTFDRPEGVLSSKRLEFWCRKAHDADSLNDLFNRIGPTAMSDDRFGYQGPPNVWSYLDGTWTDCRSQAILMKESLNLMGYTDSEIWYVYAQHMDWNGLAQQTPSGTWETNWPDPEKVDALKVEF